MAFLKYGALRGLVALGAALGLSALGQSVGRAPRYIPMAQAQEAAPAPPEAAQVFAPLAYFAQNCARCHGPNGSFYGAAFGKNLTDDKLRTAVHDMAAGPGNAPLNDHDLAIEVAYHRALIAKQPFIVVTEVTEKDGVKTLHGEVTPDSAVTILAGQTPVTAAVEDTAWTATLPPKASLQDVVIMVSQGELKTTLKLADGSWSHSEI